MPYVARGNPVLASQMNSLFTDFSSALSGIMGGKSFILAFPNAVPARLMGKPFFFTDGVCAYATKVPGAVLYQVTVQDKLTNAPAAGTGVRPYDEAAIVAAEQAKPVLSYSGTQAIIGDITAYPAGLTRVDGIGLCEHSLRVHLRVNEGKRYWLREQSAVFPEKIYRHALAEIIVEGVTQVTITNAQGKYRYFRVHNLQPRAMTFTLSGVAFALAPWECRCFVRDFDGFEAADSIVPRWKNVRQSPMLYFHEFVIGEEPLFWFWNSLPRFEFTTVTATLSADGPVLTASGGMQGNNITNPAVLFDFLWHMRETGDCLARFRRDPHVWHDMGSQFADYFACLNESGQLKADAIIGDMFHHAGDVEVNKLTQQLIAGVTRSTFRFRGYKTIVDDLAAAGFTTSLDASGNLRISRADAANFLWDLFPISTNFLKRTGYYVNVNAESNPGLYGYMNWQRVPVGVPLNINGQAVPRVIEDRIFEADRDGFDRETTYQDPRGERNFTLRNKPSYRIYQRVLAETARTFSYSGFDDTGLVVTGVPQEVITYSGGTGGTIAGIHAQPVSRLLTLKDWGDPALATQDDAHVQYLPPILRLTPEGWVLLFTESHRTDYLPFNPALSPATFDRVLYCVPPYSYAANPTNVYRFNVATGRLELKHCIRFRKHGWGWTQNGKEYALHYSMTQGRLTNANYTDAVAGPDGFDWALPQKFKPTGVKLLRQVLVTEQISGNSTVSPSRSARFFGDARPFDGWCGYDSVGRANIGSVTPGVAGRTWRTYRNELMCFYSGGATFESVANPNNPQNQPTAIATFVPMLAEHYNAMRNAVDQCADGEKNVKFTGIPLIVFGQKILNFSPATTGAWLSWETVFRNGGFPIPAPVSAFAGLNTGHADAPYYERYLNDFGVPFLGGAVSDYPDLAAHKTATAQGEVYITRALARVTATSGAGETVNGQLFQKYFGTLSIGNFTMDTPVPGVSSVGRPVIECFPFIGVNLQTDYNGKRWVSVDDFEEFADAHGFPFRFRQPFIPLTLDVLSRTSEFQDSTVKPKAETVFTGLIAAVTTGGPIINFIPPSWYEWGPMKTNGDGTVPLAFSSSAVVKQQPVFRLAENEGEIKWKMAIPTGSELSGTGYSLNGGGVHTAFNHRGDRTFGRFRLSIGAHWRWAFSGVGMGFGVATDGSLAPQWNFSQAGPGATATGEVALVNQEEIRTSGITGPHLVHADPAGPRWYLDLKIPPTEAAKRSQDRLAAVLNKERRWFALQVVSSFPDDKVRLGLIGQRDWGRVKDWWLRDAPNYAAGIRRVSPDERYAEPRDMAAPGSEFFEAPVGVTLIGDPDTDGAWRLVELSS